jgi:CHASE1-domain containing sensor protein
MNTRTAHTRPSKAARGFGYTVAAVLNAVLLYLINVRPGWRAVPFLTEDTTRVLVVVNLSLVAGIVANLLFVLYDPPRWKALGDLVTTSISLVVLFRIWAVFPFAFDASQWTLLARTVLVVAIVGTGIAMLVQVLAATGATGRSISRHS